jgi:hypothetical protein
MSPIEIITRDSPHEPRGARICRAGRLRFKQQLGHVPSGFGKGKWQNTRTLWAYKVKARRKRQTAAASRRRNRAA